MTTQTRVTLTAGAATLLGAIPLAGGFAQQRWFWYAMLAVAVVAGIGVLLRMVHAPAPLIVPAQVIGLLVYHTVVFASNRGYGGIIPNGHTLNLLNTQLSDGLHDIQYLSAPVPAQTDIVVLTSLAVGLLAIVVDVIAVSAGRPAVAGLALLALFAVATAVSARTLFFEFAGAGAGYLLLLAVEGRERLVRWGRVVTADDPVGRTGEHQTAVRMPRHGAAGRVGIVAVAAALIVPALVPGFTRNVLSSIGHGTANDGIGPQSLGSGLNPFTQLQGSLQDTKTFDVLKVTSMSNTDPWYLRVTVLDDFTSDGWRRGNFRDQIAGVGVNMTLPQGVQNLQAESHVRKIKATVKILNYEDNRLPVYYAPTNIQDAGSHWRYDTSRSEVLADSGDNTSSGQTYQIQAAEPDPTTAELLASKALPQNDEIMKRWGFRPADVPEKVRQITDLIVRGKSGPWNKAAAINSYFTDGTEGFTYTTSTKTGSSGNALLDFLQQKQGFCEQYASAMAVMLREVGIPSRVVLGYAQGKPGSKPKTWTITNKDAHAWVEGYFANVGWVEFDPTPRADGDTTTAPVFQQQTSSDPTLPTSGATGPQSSASGLPQNGPHTDPAGGGGGGGNTPTSGHGSGATTPIIAGVIGGAAFVVALLFVPTLARRAKRRRRFALARGPDPIAAAHAAWAEVLATAADIGIAFLPAESPRATAARLTRGGEMDPAAISGLRVVALAEERARYAAVAGVEGDLPTALRAARSGLLHRATRRRRFHVAAIPPSVVQSMRVQASTGYQRAVASVLSLSQLLRPGRWLPRSHPKA